MKCPSRLPSGHLVPGWWSAWRGYETVRRWAQREEGGPWMSGPVDGQSCPHPALSISWSIKKCRVSHRFPLPWLLYHDKLYPSNMNPNEIFFSPAASYQAFHHRKRKETKVVLSRHWTQRMFTDKEIHIVYTCADTLREGRAEWKQEGWGKKAKRKFDRWLTGDIQMIIEWKKCRWVDRR